MALIPDSKLNDFGQSSEVDYKVSKLVGKDIFNLLLYSLLEKNELSLRTVELNYKALFNSSTRHSSIASRLETIPVEYFKSIFEFVSEQFLSSATKNKLMIIDSTTLQLSNKLLKIGVPCRETKQGKKNSIKCVVATDEKAPKLLKLHTEQEKSGDTVLFREMILKHGKNSICVFDRGLQKRRTFQEFTEKEIQFVTRGNDNIRYNVIRRNKIIKSKTSDFLEKIEDAVVNLAAKGTRFLAFEIRLIKAKNKKTDKIYIFLSNMMELSTNEICSIYKKRWSIEVFFRFIKQELNTKHFLGRNKNAIEVNLYMILIASILILEFKKRSKISSYKFARRAFMDELMLEVFKPVVKHCGGDPEKVYSYYTKAFRYAAF